MGCQVCPLFRTVSAERDISFESCHGIQRQLTCSEALFVPLPVLKRSVFGADGLLRKCAQEWVLQSVRSSSVCRKMRWFSKKQVRHSASSILHKGSIHAAIGSQTLGIGGNRLVRRYMLCAWVAKSVRCSAGFQPSEIVRLSPVMVSSVI